MPAFPDDTVITLGELRDWALGLPPSAGTTAVLAIDGPSGAGKSTLATALAATTGAPLVRMDDLYPGWDGLAEAVPRVVEWVLEPLSRGEPARYRRYDWVENRYAEWHDVPLPAGGTRLLLVEGVASASRACAPFLAGVVWVEAEQQERFRRGIERDGETYRPHWQRWALQEAAHFTVEATRERADVVLDGDTVPAGHPVGTAWTVRRGAREAR